MKTITFDIVKGILFQARVSRFKEAVNYLDFSGRNHVSVVYFVSVLGNEREGVFWVRTQDYSEKYPIGKKIYAGFWDKRNCNFFFGCRGTLLT